MAHHPNEPLIDIIGIKESARGCACEMHRCCGDALALDSVVCFCSIQIVTCKFAQGPFSFLFYIRSSIFFNKPQLKIKKKLQLAFIGLLMV